MMKIEPVKLQGQLVRLEPLQMNIANSMRICSQMCAVLNASIDTLIGSHNSSAHLGGACTMTRLIILSGKQYGRVTG